MGAFLLGFLIAGLIGITLVYGCYNKREITEKRLRQNIANLDHNLAMITKESELKIDQLETDLKRCRDENRKSIQKIEILHKDLTTVRDQLDECKQKLSE